MLVKTKNDKKQAAPLGISIPIKTVEDITAKVNEEINSRGSFKLANIKIEFN